MVPIKNYETGSEFVVVMQNAGKTVNFFPHTLYKSVNIMPSSSSSLLRVCLCGFSSSDGRKLHANQIRLSVGIHNLTANEPSVRHPEIKRMVHHPDYFYDEYNKSYDIALFELRKPLKYNDKISPICVDDSVFPPKTDCFVTGWGFKKGKN